MNSANLTAEQLRRRYESLEFVVRGDTVLAKVDGFFYGLMNGGEVNEETVRALNRMQSFIEAEPRLIEKGYSGWYAIVTNENVMFADNESTALDYQSKHPEVFVQRIGVCGPDLMVADSGQLGESEIPVDFSDQVETVRNFNGATAAIYL